MWCSLPPPRCGPEHGCRNSAARCQGDRSLCGFQNQGCGPLGELVWPAPQCPRADSPGGLWTAGGQQGGYKGASLIACPGCYPTSVQLGFLPLLEAGCIDLGDLIANSASGVSGAGRQASIGTLHAEMSDSFKAYAATGHRHHPEIVQGLGDIAGESAQPGDINLTFVPHLLPINRGIHTTLYANLTTEVDVQELFEQRYRDEPFVDVLPAGSHPETRTVRGSNLCRIAVCRPGGGNKVVVLVVEDNLTKGASGQGVQCMNILFGLPEDSGLTAPALLP